MKLSIETGSYNARRYGKPYIGVVSAESGRVTRWGTWIGTPGQAGILEIEAVAGDVIVKGQRDNRGNNGTPDYAVVQDDGTLKYMSKAEAIKAARDLRQQAAGTDARAGATSQADAILREAGLLTYSEALEALRTAYADIQRLPGHTIDMLGRIEAAITKATGEQA